MAEFLRIAFAIAAKDIRLELRSRTALLSAIVFSALVLVVFNFARDPTALAAVDLAPSVLWVTFAFGAVIALNRAFYVERENAALDGILLAPVPRERPVRGEAVRQPGLRRRGRGGGAAAVRPLLQRRAWGTPSPASSG